MFELDENAEKAARRDIRIRNTTVKAVNRGLSPKIAYFFVLHLLPNRMCSEIEVALNCSYCKNKVTAELLVLRKGHSLK